MIHYNTSFFYPRALLPGIFYKNILTKMSLDMYIRTFIARLVAIERLGDNTLKFHAAISKNKYFTIWKNIHGMC